MPDTQTIDRQHLFTIVDQLDDGVRRFDNVATILDMVAEKESVDAASSLGDALHGIAEALDPIRNKIAGAKDMLAKMHGGDALPSEAPAAPRVAPARPMTDAEARFTDELMAAEAEEHFLSPAVRALIAEFGVSLTRQFIACGVRRPNRIRHLITEARKIEGGRP